MTEIKKVEYEGRDEKNNYCFSDGKIEYKYSQKQIEIISERNYFPDEIMYELIIENGITVKINSAEEKIKVKTTSKLIEKIELREKIKRHLKLGDDISELLEKLAKLQGENETIEFIEKVKEENKDNNKKEKKEYAKQNGVDKTLYLILCFVLGGLGIHKFYAKKYMQGVLYLVFCWTWIPAIIGLLEGFLVIKKPADKYGMIYLEEESKKLY